MASIRCHHVVAAALLLCACSKAQEMNGVATIGEMEDTFTVPQSEYTGGATSCSTVMAGCTGTFVNGATHKVEGVITVVDDCTFEISGWQFDGMGPAVEWWAAMQDDRENVFPYPANAIKVGELGPPGNYQTGSDHGGDSEVVVRLGKAEDGSQVLLSPEFNHISLWCEEFAVDFGNAALSCSASDAEATEESGAAPASALSLAAGTAAAVATMAALLA